MLLECVGVGIRPLVLSFGPFTLREVSASCEIWARFFYVFADITRQEPRRDRLSEFESDDHVPLSGSQL